MIDLAQNAPCRGRRGEKLCGQLTGTCLGYYGWGRRFNSMVRGTVSKIKIVANKFTRCFLHWNRNWWEDLLATDSSWTTCHFFASSFFSSFRYTIFEKWTAPKRKYRIEGTSWKIMEVRITPRFLMNSLQRKRLHGKKSKRMGGKK